MGQARPSSLAVLHRRYDAPVDLDEAVNIRDKLHKRRLELDSLIKPPDSEQTLAKQISIYWIQWFDHRVII